MFSQESDSRDKINASAYSNYSNNRHDNTLKNSSHKKQGLSLKNQLKTTENKNKNDNSILSIKKQITVIKK